MYSRPNVLVIMPDQIRADALGCFGNALPHTPNADALAACGTGLRERVLDWLLESADVIPWDADSRFDGEGAG